MKSATQPLSMTFPSRTLLSISAFVALAAACSWLGWVGGVRQERVARVSALAGALDAGAPGTEDSRTGCPRNQRRQIVPERLEESYHWIAQTQQMLASGEARVRAIDYENAPFGRTVRTPSPYRWWLGVVAWAGQKLAGWPAGIAVERATLFAGPMLQILLLLVVAGLAAWRLGSGAALLLVGGLAGFFPLNTGFLPGVPASHELTTAVFLLSLLLLLAGLRDPRQHRGWWIAAGLLGGCGLWIDVTAGGLLIAGSFTGAMLATWLIPTEAPPPWRHWALAGALTSGLGFLLEYFPAHLGGMELGWNHPLYALAWIGLGELLALVVARRSGVRPPWRGSDSLRVMLAVVAVAALPVAIVLQGGVNFPGLGLEADRLTNLPDGAVATNAWSWWQREGVSWAVVASVLPLGLLVPAGWVLWRRDTDLRVKRAVVVALGAVGFGLALAGPYLSWWGMLEAALLGLLFSILPGASSEVTDTGARWRGGLCATVILLGAAAGMTAAWPREHQGEQVLLTGREAQQVIERHLAQWLVRRADQPGAVVYAAPRALAALSYFGGLRGLGSYAEENRDGLGVTLAIVNAGSLAEAKVMLQARDVRFLVFPSWDPFFDHVLADQPGAAAPGKLIPALKRWHLPPWLRAQPYKGIMPLIGGFEGESVLVLEVVEDQPPVLAACRLADYLVEIGRPDQAGEAMQLLAQYPGDLAALASLMQLNAARNNYAEASRLLEQVQARLAVRADRSLVWDRRVSLAVILAQGKRLEPAREQAKRCLADMNSRRLRTLTDGTLVNLHVLLHRLGLTWPDEQLRTESLELLPPELREKLAQLTAGGGR